MSVVYPHSSLGPIFKQPVAVDFNSGDFLPDSDYEHALELGFNLEPINVGNEIDKVERFTQKLFVNLFELADGYERKDIKEAFSNESLDDEEEIFSPALKRGRYSKGMEPESNWLKEDYDYSISFRSVITRVMSFFTDFFFGYKLYEIGGKKEGSCANLLANLKEDQKLWECILKKKYKHELHQKMDYLFKQAFNFLENKARGEKAAFANRSFFYAGIIISGLGKFTDSKLVMIGGSVISAFGFLSMFKHYLSSSFSESSGRIKFNSMVQAVYQDVHKNRLIIDSPSSPTPSLEN